MRVFVSRVDDHRDRLLTARIERLLVDLSRGDSLVPSSAAVGLDATEEDELRRLLETSDAILCFYSPEASTSVRVGRELHLASALGKPGCLLLFPGMRPPGWADRATWIVPLAGFKDSGPGLPPGTDEWEILRQSTFVRKSLAAVTEFVNAVREGTAPALPLVPSPNRGPRRHRG